MKFAYKMSENVRDGEICRDGRGEKKSRRRMRRKMGGEVQRLIPSSFLVREVKRRGSV